MEEFKVAYEQKIAKTVNKPAPPVQQAQPAKIKEK